MEGVAIVTTRSAVSGMDGCCLCAWPPGHAEKRGCWWLAMSRCVDATFFRWTLYREVCVDIYLLELYWDFLHMDAYYGDNHAIKTVGCVFSFWVLSTDFSWVHCNDPRI